MAGDPRPDTDRPPTLRVPTTPQREYFIDQAAALLIYLEEGGAVSRLSIYGGDQQAVVAFAVDDARYQALRAELRLAREGPPPPRLPWGKTQKRARR